MLESNTDRSFWMVGSIIVGSALVTSAKPAFKAILDSITTWFKKMIKDTSDNTLTGVTVISSHLPQLAELAAKLPIL